MRWGWTICIAAAVAVLIAACSAGSNEATTAKDASGTPGPAPAPQPPPPAPALPPDNAIVIENRKPGTAGVLATLMARYSPKSAPIAGYADSTSVDRGGQIRFKVSTSQPGAYTIKVYRMGFYGGAGTRLVASSGVLQGVTQRTCEVTDSVTHLMECDWDDSYTLRVGRDWTSGIYVTVLTHTATANEAPIFFVVRDERHSDIVFQSARTTGLAYNYWGNATEWHSLYGSNSSGNIAAQKVSFDRPSTDRDVLEFEFPMLRWLESQGYDVTYITNMDVHTDAAQLLNHRIFLSVGHDEYWSQEMRDGIEAARNTGVNLGFFSANTSYYRVRFEPSSDGRADRVMVCYKDRTLTPDPLVPTYRWRDPPNNRPENALLGVMYIGYVSRYEPGFDWVAANAADPYFANTTLENGSTLSQLVGYEWDGVVDNGFTPPGLVILGASPGTPASVAAGMPRTATQVVHTTRYTHSSGAQVFATGNIHWIWGLDSTLIREPRVDARAQQFTVNVLASMRARPSTPDSGIVVP